MSSSVLRSGCKGSYTRSQILRKQAQVGLVQGFGTRTRTRAMSSASDLKSKRCVPCEGGLPPLKEEEINELRAQVPEWEVDTTGNSPKLIRNFKAKNFLSGLTMFERFGAVAEEEGHHPDLHLTGWNKVKVEISTHSIGGLSQNDFILASKLDAVSIEDLQRKKKVTT